MPSARGRIMLDESAAAYTLCEIKDGVDGAPAPSPQPVTKRPGARRRRRRQWLISPESFRELRHSCLLSNRKAAAAYLGVCVRTIRHWDTGRNRVPWSAVRLLRLLRAGDLGGLLDGWNGWTIYRDRLVSPDGRAYRERDMRHLWLTLTQASLFREGYDRAIGHASAVRQADGAAASAGARLFPADSARAISGADRETVAAPGALSPLPCRTALKGAPADACRRGAAWPPAGRQSGADDQTPRQNGVAWNRACTAGGGNMMAYCYHTPTSQGDAVTTCNASQTALLCHSPLADDVSGYLPTANRGGNFLNKSPSDVILTSLAEPPCKGVAP